ncbi:hypothetical protein D3C87_1541210 [compost metagenome]
MRAVDDFLRGFRAGQHRQALVEILLAQLGHCKRAGGALDQAHAKALFQQGDAPAEPGFGDAQRPPGGRESAVLHDLDEVVKVIQVVHAFSSSFWMMDVRASILRPRP